MSATGIPAQDEIGLLWLGTAGFLLRYRDLSCALDPLLSRWPGAHPVFPTTLEDLSGIGSLLFSHGHFDHVYDAALIAKASSAKVLAPAAVCAALTAAGLPAERLHALERTTRFELGEMAWVEVHPAPHVRFDPLLILRTAALVLRSGTLPLLLRLILQFPRGANADFLLSLGGRRLHFSGSGGAAPDVVAALEPDCLLLPFAGRSDAVPYFLRLLRTVRPATVVLHHFDRFFPGFCVDYPVEEFVAVVRKTLPDLEVLVPEPGKWLWLGTVRKYPGQDLNRPLGEGEAH